MHSAPFRNSSCGRLCDYDEPLVSGIHHQALALASETATVRLPDKNKFVSTPLFNVQASPPSPMAAAVGMGMGGGAPGGAFIGEAGADTHYAHVLHQQQQQQQQATGLHHPHLMPASFSCQPLVSMTATPTAADLCNSTASSRRTKKRQQHQQERLLKTQGEREQQEMRAAAENSFYAATDIFKVRVTLYVAF